MFELKNPCKIDKFTYLKFNVQMRTTIEIPQELMEEAMRLSDAKTKSQLIKEALEEYVKNIKIKRLLTFSGSIDLEIDLDILRDRKQFLPMT